MNVAVRTCAGVVVLTAVLALTCPGQVRLPRLVADGMVLQRDAPVRIWGWAPPGRDVAVTFIDSTYRSRADSAGAWSVMLAPHGAGGPCAMRVACGDTVSLHDILLGDVWVCSGQSNMELQVERVRPLYEREIAASANTDVRQFLVPQRYNFDRPDTDLSAGSWVAAAPNTVPDFSAAAWFFARALYERYRIPIGLINTSLGGSPVESWMSAGALGQFPALLEEAVRYRDTTFVDSIQRSDRARIGAWYAELRGRDAGFRGRPWYDTRVDIARWSRMRIPGYWNEPPAAPVNGVVWFARAFTVPDTLRGKEARLTLGRIVDADSAFVNGVFVGTTGYQYPPRRYAIPPGVLRAGPNRIVVRVISNAGRGGFVPDKPYEISRGATRIDLAGEWRYRTGAVMKPLGPETFIRWKPLGLYNAMLAPLLPYRIRGVIWYQGESNAARALEYRRLFPALIADWRARWGEGDFPFLFVQLPNFMEPRDQPSESGWALLREAQLRALAVPRTGMAVTIDIGEWNDIHPMDKKDVGERLALAARRIAYGDSAVIAQGPLCSAMRAAGDSIVITFTDTGSGLMARGGPPLRSFAVAGEDRRFVWADANIEGGSVVVRAKGVPHPVAVRYAWADNPAGANLFNREGLPASPFRTDDWPPARRPAP